MQDESELALLLATVGAIPLIGAVVRSTPWGAAPTVGLLMVALALRMLVTSVRPAATSRLPEAHAAMPVGDDENLLRRA